MIAEPSYAFTLNTTVTHAHATGAHTSMYFYSTTICRCHFSDEWNPFHFADRVLVWASHHVRTDGSVTSFAWVCNWCEDTSPFAQFQGSDMPTIRWEFWVQLDGTHAPCLASFARRCWMTHAPAALACAGIRTTLQGIPTRVWVCPR